MLGLAVGDALGATTEGQLPHRQRAAHGEIRGHLPYLLALFLRTHATHPPASCWCARRGSARPLRRRSG